MKKTYETGIAGEQKAAEWLRTRYGMRLLETRFRTKAGEIDLIMKDGEVYVFVEVKTRLNAPSGTGLMAVDRKKQGRIARAASIYLMQNRLLNRQVRFDVCEVSADSVLYIPNAFQPGGLFYR